MRYLERFAASSEQLRRVLTRRVKRAAALAENTEPGEAAGRIETIITRFLAAGLLNDRAFAEAQAASLRRRGGSRRHIKHRLAAKGIPGEMVDDALIALDEEMGSGDLAAACALARRRRLGPYRAPATRELHRQKDLATFARAGFSLDIARRILAAPDIDALEKIQRELDIL